MLYYYGSGVFSANNVFLVGEALFISLFVGVTSFGSGEACEAGLELDRLLSLENAGDPSVVVWAFKPALSMSSGRYLG